MVHATASLSRLAAGLGLFIVVTAGGCAVIEKQTWSSLVGPTQAGQMEMIWYRDVKYLPDPTRGGTPSMAIGGRMFLFTGQAKSHPLTADGNLVIQIYDDAPIEGGQPKLLETTNVTPEVLTRLASTDQVGLGYTLVVPFPKDRPNLKQVHLTVRYEPKSGPALTDSSPTMTLDFGAKGPSALQPAARTINQ